ncbi:T-cell receptor-associated transmembrane adapter 1 isoform X2 [Hemicordylus capensis]|nr:T-cell receptor-associated transmembrane adapter 1 isoform X2 [Hemicordylus capensis]XP_053166321.1 T-cell receptor-associated transmembrane adapter 1 isoform X2 [Hemicordylus capensis]XP_053166322.1 T-cell receptor-associated transmembrane adapter 1 isoform X2 [Hemicordylus capensis]
MRDCLYLGIPLALVTTVMIISLVKNILYYLKEKKQKGKNFENYQDYSPSNGEVYTEECPVYDNLNHHQEILNESCYEQMSAHPQTPTHEIQPPVERQMCYASLDHSVKRKQKNLRKKKYPTVEVEDQLPRSSSMPFDSCIYLNSEQLNAENKASEDNTHDDPQRPFGLIHATSDVNF